MVGYGMNEHFTFPPQRPTTQAAEGLPRWRWTLGEVERLGAAGFFSEYDKFELLGGEIVPMSPKGRRHELVREELTFRSAKLAPPGIFVAAEPQLSLSADTFTVPDILVRPAAIKTPDLRGSDALLLIEIADSSLGYDLETKAPLYASHGIPEYWVINALMLMTTVYLGPSGNVYGTSGKLPPTARLVPSLVPQLAVSLNALDLGD
jgi:Uma2 family endonuclease